ncbi:hypothetical protein M8B70_21070 [Enterobacter chengduensis]|uniref:hypothetical protein n=1 Tax=Enterobacteriaceae TaxID=543 RepID=UPI001B815700|nr:hypothetical protein [Enterobacter chengduensis]HBC2889717.1 Arm DNA-binding domain-containing protein [Citrobacter freundii]MCW4822204.1 hypothetical protein [Enterobacter chengduensis]MCW5064137.1 hypothetical protein [Enterobacter chengduensis]MCW5068993.1 hypothetical protein [Enterobacter chengduensis]MCW5081946.1 hypothetical protein [Enterobacter chengduensis]
MFKVIVTRTDHTTGKSISSTDPRSFKTRRNAEKAADRIGYVCSPDGKTITMSMDAEVVEVRHA